MALADDIRVLRDRVVVDLKTAHDYYTDTITAWDIVRQAIIAGGHKFSIRNVTTGTVTTEVELATKARGYVANQLTEATFQEFIAIFENFFFDLLRLWLLAFPQSLATKKVDFSRVLDAPDRDAITLLVVMVLSGPPQSGGPSLTFLLQAANGKISESSAHGRQECGVLIIVFFILLNVSTPATARSLILRMPGLSAYKPFVGN